MKCAVYLLARRSNRFGTLEEAARIRWFCLCCVSFLSFPFPAHPTQPQAPFSSRVEEPMPGCAAVAQAARCLCTKQAGQTIPCPFVLLEAGRDLLQLPCAPPNVPPPTHTRRLPLPARLFAASLFVGSAEGYAAVVRACVWACRKWCVWKVEALFCCAPARPHTQPHALLRSSGGRV